MSGRRSIGGGCLLILLTLAITFFLSTYNVTTHIKYPLPTLVPDDGVRFSRVEPVIRIRHQDLSPRTRRNPRFHIAVTATEVPYSRWQCRIMYYWYLKVKDGPGSAMGGFTRILHSGRPDSLMEEIPTFVVDPLPHGLDKDYVVLNRPWAFVQWLERATIEEDYVLMGEPDHIFVKPLPNLAYGGRNPAAFHFTYIEPVEYENVVRKFYPQDKGPISNVDPIGSSPVIISKILLKEIAPTWKEIALRIRNDPEANTAFGWVQEMYAYAIASALHGVKHNIYKDFMIQPPWDKKVGRSYIIHYTYASDFTMKGEWTDAKRGDWHFDKRLHQDSPIPKNITLPPRGTPESVVTLIKKLNEATANIPKWENS